LTRYDDANKKLFSFGQKYNENLTDITTSLKNGLAIALPWKPTSGLVVLSGSNEKSVFISSKTHYVQNLNLMNSIGETDTYVSLTNDAQTAFNN
jgi:hypothetical protein